MTQAGEDQKAKALRGFANYLTEKFGKPYTVDNLQVIPAQLNLSKGNKIDYDFVPPAFRPEEN